MTNRCVGNLFSKSAKVLAAGAILAAVPAAQALVAPVPLPHGTNLSGIGAGLDENYISTGGIHIGLNYVTPNGINLFVLDVAAGGTMPGMTESIRGSSATPLGINIPQPMFLPTGDPRSGIGNPLLAGSPQWGARTGAVLRWDVLDSSPPGFPGTPQFLLPAGSVTGQAYNLTPQVVIGQSGPTFDDGLAPGSVAGDGIPDFLPFFTEFSGRRTAVFTLEFFDEDDSALFGGVVPTALIPRVRLYEGGDLLTAASPPLDEAAFDHNDGNQGDVTGDEIDDAVDGTLLLGGRLHGAFATLLWEEIDGAGTPGFQQSGRFQLDIQFFANVRYDEGSLLGQVNEIGDVNASWDNIPFGQFVARPAGPGLAFTGGDDINGLGIYDFRESPSASQTFTAANIIPEPLTAGMGLLSLGALAGYATRRRKA